MEANDQRSGMRYNSRMNGYRGHPCLANTQTTCHNHNAFSIHERSKAKQSVGLRGVVSLLAVIFCSEHEEGFCLLDSFEDLLRDIGSGGQADDLEEHVSQ